MGDRALRRLAARIPPLLGFIGKFYLFVAGVDAGQIALVVIAALNSAISAWYYLRLVGLPLLAKPNAQSETIVRGPVAWPRIAAVLTSIAVVVVPVFGQSLLKASASATGQAKNRNIEVSKSQD